MADIEDYKPDGGGGGGYSGGSYGQPNNGGGGCISRILCCLCCPCIMLIIGAVLLGLSVSMLGAAAGKDTYGENIKSYNNDVKAWTATHAEEFDNFAVTVMQATITKTAHKLTNTGETAGDSDDADKLDDYTPLMYRSTDSMVADQVYSADVLHFKYSFAPRSGGASTNIQVDLPAFKQNRYNWANALCHQGQQCHKNKNGQTVCTPAPTCTAECADAKGGLYSATDDLCYVRSKLQYVCTKFDASDNKVTLDESQGGPGCYLPETELSTGYELDGVTGGAYKKVSSTTPLVATHDFKNLYADARSAQDPYLKHLFRNGGKNSFGLTRGEKLALATFLLILSIIFLMPFICCLLVVVCAVGLGLLGIGTGAKLFLGNKKKDEPNTNEANVNIQPLVNNQQSNAYPMSYGAYQQQPYGPGIPQIPQQGTQLKPYPQQYPEQYAQQQPAQPYAPQPYAPQPQVYQQQQGYPQGGMYPNMG